VLLFALIAPSAALGVSKAMADSGRRSGVPLALVRDVPLPGGTTRFDYASVDTNGRKLYIAHLGDSTLDVVDLDTLHVAAVVPSIAGVHGVALAADRGRVYATATGDNELVTIDSTTNHVIARTPTGDFPDGVAYDPDHALVFVSDKNAGSITVVSADTGKVTDTIKVAEETGNVAYDSAARLVYAAARTPDALVAIDPTSSKITSRIRLPGCNGAHGVSIDAATNRAFVACERNARLVTVDLTRRAESARSRRLTSPTPWTSSAPHPSCRRRQPRCSRKRGRCFRRRSPPESRSPAERTRQPSRTATTPRSSSHWSPAG
jgi:YVTN family beta-propeller protein